MQNESIQNQPSESASLQQSVEVLEQMLAQARETLAQLPDAIKSQGVVENPNTLREKQTRSEQHDLARRCKKRIDTIVSILRELLVMVAPNSSSLQVSSIHPLHSLLEQIEDLPVDQSDNREMIRLHSVIALLVKDNNDKVIRGLPDLSLPTLQRMYNIAHASDDQKRYILLQRMPLLLLGILIEHGPSTTKEIAEKGHIAVASVYGAVHTLRRALNGTPFKIKSTNRKYKLVEKANTVPNSPKSH